MVNKNKKTMIIIFVVVLVVGIFLILLSSGKNLTQPPPKITSSAPQNSSKEVEEDSSFSFVFEKEVTEEEKSSISVVSKPKVRLSKSWKSNTVLVLIPLDFMLNNTDYKIQILHKDAVINEVMFKTALYSKKELRLQAVEQSEGDFLFNEALEETFEEMPWLQELPIKTQNHTIVYDFDKNSIRIRLLIPSSSSAAEKEAAKKTALKSLEDSKIDAETITYYILYQNK